MDNEHILLLAFVYWVVCAFVIWICSLILP
jgi:hypothetical protein